MPSWFSFFFVKQKTAYEMRISDWSSDVCSSDLASGQLEALDTRRADILDDEAGPALEIEADRGDLLIAVIPAECFEIELQPIVEKAVFQADRISRDGFGRSEEHTSELQSLMRL